MQIFSDNPDEEFKILREKGYSGSLNDMAFKYLGDQGYTKGALADRILAYFRDEFGGLSSWKAVIATEFSDHGGYILGRWGDINKLDPVAGFISRPDNSAWIDPFRKYEENGLRPSLLSSFTDTTYAKAP